MRRNGLMVVFEGLDGSGKGTQLGVFKSFLESEDLLEDGSQIKLFKERVSKAYGGKNQQFDMFSSFLKKEKMSFVTYDFPRYYDNYWGKMVGRLLTGEFGQNMNPYPRSVFYFLDQADACKTIKKELKEGKIIICNRYLTSSYIFQAALIRKKEDKRKYIEWLEETAYGKLKMVRPDVVLALYVDPIAAQRLIEKKELRKYTNGKTKDINEKNIKLQINASKEMLKYCKERREWKLINCMDGDNIKKPEEIALLIKDALKSYLY